MFSRENIIKPLLYCKQIGLLSLTKKLCLLNLPRKQYFAANVTENPRITISKTNCIKKNPKLGSKNPLPEGENIHPTEEKIKQKIASNC